MIIDTFGENNFSLRYEGGGDGLERTKEVLISIYKQKGKLPSMDDAKQSVQLQDENTGRSMIS